jgi:hypothetical protein
MPYTHSYALRRWLGPRHDAIATLARAHTWLAELDDPARPLRIGRPVAHAYILRLVAEFQAYARDSHDLAADTIVKLSEAKGVLQVVLFTAATEGRMIDRGNADLRTLELDFRRVGLAGLNDRLGVRIPCWARTSARRGDRASYQDLIQLRNALAHGNDRQLDQLRNRGVTDTVSWGRARLAELDRFAHALDEILWEHVRTSFGVDPW